MAGAYPNAGMIERTDPASRSPLVNGSQPAPSALDDEDLGGYGGICQDCAIRSTCSFPRAPGGIWHCAEYQ